MAVVRWRAADAARQLVRLIEMTCPTTLERADEALLRDAAAIAADERLTVYDAAYVAAARQNGWTLVSADIADLVRPGLAIAPDALALAG